MTTGANPLRGEAAFDSGGERYTLVFDNEAFCRIEGATGESFFDTLEGIQNAEREGKKPKLSSMRALLWGGFQARHPEVTLADAGDFILRSDVGALHAMTTAISASMPRPEAAPANPPKKGRAGTGSN